MLRSLYSGISGLRANQTMMDVVGNNIANVNTVGFKASTAVFQDSLSQALQNAGAPAPGVAGRGGTNPAQVGLGVRVAAITTNFGTGAQQTTGRGSDIMLQGDGFLVENLNGKQVYTRNGALNLDGLGTLVGPDGGKVQGWLATATAVTPATTPATYTGAFTWRPATAGGDPAETTELTIGAQTSDGTATGAKLTGFSIGADGVVSGSFANGSTRAVAQLAIGTFTNPAGLQKVGSSAYATSANSGVATLDAAGSAGRGDIVSGFLEMSNVDLAGEFTNLIISQRGFQANSRIITAGDEILQDLINIKR